MALDVGTGTTGTGVEIVDRCADGRNHVTTLTVNTTLPAIAGGAALGVGNLLYTFPTSSVVVVKSAYMSIAITQADGNITADTPDVGIGTTIASGANATLDAVGAAAENILTGQTATDCNGTATVATVSNQILDIATGGDHTVYLNVADTWAASGDAGAALTGTVVLEWVHLA